MNQLRLGSAGDDVTSLQLGLVAVGLLAGEPTSQFDGVTQKAVMELQRQAGLPQTGVVDERTWNALWQGQASVAPSPDTNTPGTGPVPGTTYTDPLAVQARPPGMGMALFFGLLAGGAYWYIHKGRAHGQAEYGDNEEDEYEEDDDEDDDFEPALRRAHLSDSVTDSLIDEPAVISRSGRPGDCKKAAMRLMRIQGLVQRPSEHQLYNRVVKKVASNCRGEEAAIEEAITSEQDRREEAEQELGNKLTAGLESRITETDEGTRKRTFVEPGFRKTKHRSTRKTTSERETQRNTGKGQGNRRGASTVQQRRGGKVIQKLRKEKAKTKRGYTWRKEEGD